MKRVGALVQVVLFVVASVGLRLANADPDSFRFHSKTMLVLTCVVLGLGLLARGMHHEPFFKHDLTNPRWALYDPLRRTRPLVWKILDFAMPFEWIPLGALTAWLATELDEKQPIVRVGWIHAGAVPAIQHTFLGLVLVLSYIYLSTLIDEFYIVPRLRGGYGDGALQCVRFDRSGAPNRVDWRSVTRLWLAHRLVTQAASLTTIGVVALLFLRDCGVDLSNELVLAPVAALASVYLASRFPVLLFILNPPLAVGDSVELAEEFTVRKQFPHYFVVDVSLEGIKLLIYELLVDSTSQSPGSGATGGATATAAASLVGVPTDLARTHDRVVNAADVGKLLRDRESERPCQMLDVGPDHCQSLNRYCPIREARRRRSLSWIAAELHAANDTNSPVTGSTGQTPAPSPAPSAPLPSPAPSGPPPAVAPGPPTPTAPASTGTPASISPTAGVAAAGGAARSAPGAPPPTTPAMADGTPPRAAATASGAAAGSPATPAPRTGWRRLFGWRP